MIKVSDYVIKRLEETGTGHMFMLPGGGAMHLNDSLGRSAKIKYICCLHEQACSIAAEAYARVSNTPGLLMVTTGPGGTNALTGVTAAFIESTPMIVISGQVKQLDQIRDQGVRQQGMQEVDIISMVESVTKYATMIREPKEIAYHMDKAIYEATSGRPGPVWLDIPLDVQASTVDEDSLERFIPEEENLEPDAELVDRIINELNNCERPVLLIGNGIRLSDGINELHELIDELQMPVLTSWNGLDLIHEKHPCYFGRPGGLGHRYANFIQQNSDFFMSVGARLNLLQTGYNFDGFARCATRVMVDIDEKELTKINVRPTIPVKADAKKFLEALLKKADKIKKKDYSTWFSYCNKLKDKYPLITDEYREEKNAVNTYVLVEELSKQMKAEDIYVAGSSGSCIEISMQAFLAKENQRVFTTKGLASMGYGLPSTIGAALASNGRNVVCLNGDGGFQMNIQELETIRRLGLPIKIFVLNNGGYAAIQGTQTNLFDKCFVACNRESGLTLPDTIKVTTAYNLKTEIIYNNSELQSKIKNILESKEPVICEVMVPIDLKVLPKQVSYKTSDGQMESLPLEYLNPMLDEEEFNENMLIPIYEKK